MAHFYRNKQNERERNSSSSNSFSDVGDLFSVAVNEILICRRLLSSLRMKTNHTGFSSSSHISLRWESVYIDQRFFYDSTQVFSTSVWAIINRWEKTNCRRCVKICVTVDLQSLISSLFFLPRATNRNARMCPPMGRRETRREEKEKKRARGNDYFSIRRQEVSFVFVGEREEEEEKVERERKKRVRTNK